MLGSAPVPELVDHTVPSADSERERSFALLARVSASLGGSLDPDETVARVAAVSVPDLCDWCVVDLADDQGRLELASRAHRDPALEPVIDELRRRYPPDTAAHPIYEAIREERTIAEVLGIDDLRRRARDAKHFGLLRRLGIGSHVVTPLSTRERIIGAVSFVRGPLREPFDADALTTAEDIAGRAAVAIDNARLYRAVQDALELRDEFLAVAAHELRTPLTVVSVHWELLERSLRRAIEAAPDDDVVMLDRQRVANSVERLGEAIRRLRRLVTELLDVNRIQRGVLEMYAQEVDLVEVARHAAEEVVEPSRIELDLPEAPIVGWWDVGRLRQVFDNLLANALKYSRPGSPVLLGVSRDNSIARLAVSDSGIGIPEDQLEAIFRPFTRGRNVTSRNYPGLGLGLAVSREIVMRSGGRIWVESAGEGAGSRFVVELPLRRAAIARARTPSP